jgi:hypothetical protein
MERERAWDERNDERWSQPSHKKNDRAQALAHLRLDSMRKALAPLAKKKKEWQGDGDQETKQTCMAYTQGYVLASEGVLTWRRAPF